MLLSNKSTRHSKSGFKRGVHSNTILTPETRKISNEQPNLRNKVTRKRRANKIQS